VPKVLYNTIENKLKEVNVMFNLVPNGRGLTSVKDFDDMLEGFFGNRRIPQIKVNKKEDDKNYILDFVIPGFKKEEINIELKNQYLSVKAQKEQKEEGDNQEKIIAEEYGYVSSERSFYVGNIKDEDVKATFENGIVKVIIPKEKVETVKKIEIE
jgi:HSP20 family molecular chaperone IbpA